MLRCVAAVVSCVPIFGTWCAALDRLDMVIWLCVGCVDGNEHFSDAAVQPIRISTSLGFTAPSQGQAQGSRDTGHHQQSSITASQQPLQLHNTSTRNTMEGLGQLFSKETQAIFYNWKEKPVQVGCQFVGRNRTQHRMDGTKLTQIAVPVTRSACWISTFCAVSVAVCGETIACAVPPSPAGPGQSSCCSTTAPPGGPAVSSTSPLSRRLLMLPTCFKSHLQAAPPLQSPASCSQAPMGASKRCSLATRRLPSLCMAGVLVLLVVVVPSRVVCAKCCCSALHLPHANLAHMATVLHSCQKLRTCGADTHILRCRLCCCCLSHVHARSTTEAAKKHPRADVFVNYASFRRWGQFAPSPFDLGLPLGAPPLPPWLKLWSLTRQPPHAGTAAPAVGAFCICTACAACTACASAPACAFNPRAVPQSPLWRPCRPPLCVWWLSLLRVCLRRTPSA